MPHSHPHAFRFLNPGVREGLTLSRRNLLKASLAGFGGLTLPGLASRTRRGQRQPARSRSSCCGWPAGRARSTPGPQAGPPAREPRAVRRHRRRSCPASLICEHLPKQAAMLDRFTLIRSVDCPAQQPRAEQGLPDRQPRGRAAHQPRGAQLPGHRLARRQAPRRRTTRHAALRRVHAVAQRTSPSAATSASSTTRSSPTRPRRLPVYDLVGKDTGTRRRRRRCSSCRSSVTPDRLDDRRDAAQATSTGCAPTSTASGAMAAHGPATASRRSRCSTGGRVRDALDLSKEPAGDPRPLRQAPLVPAGAARPAAGRGRRRVRHARPELPHRVGHLGHARRQHPALRRHQARASGRCCRCSTT